MYVWRQRDLHTLACRKYMEFSEPLTSFSLVITAENLIVAHFNVSILVRHDDDDDDDNNEDDDDLRLIYPNKLMLTTSV